MNVNLLLYQCLVAISWVYDLSSTPLLGRSIILHGSIDCPLTIWLLLTVEVLLTDTVLLQFHGSVTAFISLLVNYHLTEFNLISDGDYSSLLLLDNLKSE